MKTGRPKVKDYEKLEVISLRLTKIEKLKLELEAKKEGMNLSEFIRAVLKQSRM